MPDSVNMDSIEARHREELRDSVDRMARAMAAMYFFLADEVTKAFGEEGRKALARGIRRFGLYRGTRIRRRADAAGAGPSLEAFRKFYDLPLGAAWKTRRWPIPDGQVSEIEYCPMAAEWEEMGAGEEALGYCAVDFAIAEGFDKRMVFSRESSLPAGQNCCRHVVTLRKG
ncbi:MAG: L-2-amino-thiazoline-4-carboxylic acid hydrolase [Bacillota bacterium]